MTQTSETFRSVCPLDCPDACGFLLTVEDGKIQTIQGDPGHPYTRGFLCSKVRNSFLKKMAPENRITTPLLRTGPKGSGEFTPISLEKALDLAAEKIQQTVQKKGGEAILPYSYAGNMGALQRPAGDPFFHKLGASILLKTICSTAGSAGLSRHAGDFPGTDPMTAEHSDLIIVWGMNIKVTSSHFVPVINRARKNGAKLVVIDVYRNATAEMADLFIRINPGRDADLALALSRELTSRKLVDPESISRHATDVPEFLHYLEGLSTQGLLTQAGVSGEDLERLLRMITDSRATFLRTGIGLTRNSRGESSMRAIASLAALLGLFTHSDPGKGFLYATGSFSGGSQVVEAPHLRKEPGRKINMLQLAQALEDRHNPIYLLIVYNSNPLAVAPDRERVLAGLGRDDLFTIVHEQTMTETALFADLIIPATTSLENTDVYRSYGQHFLVPTDPVVEPPEGILSNGELFRELARRLGFTEPEFTETIQEKRRRYLDSLKSGGLPDGSAITAGIPVRSQLPEIRDRDRMEGKWKFHFACKDQREFEPTPFAHTHDLREFDAPNLTVQYPYKLITPPHREVLNSTFSEFQKGPGELLIHPEDARREKIENGDRVTLKNGRGEAIRLAKVSTSTSPGLLVAEGVFRGMGDHGGINNLTSTELSETAGGGVFHESRVSISMSSSSVTP